jgi:acyl-CoA reductase-like NAD-dependent aldehyde dehydrogenase
MPPVLHLDLPAVRAGIPSAVFQVLTGDAQALTRALLVKDAVRAVIGVGSSSFTGRQSGLGREGGRAGIFAFMEQKYVCIGSAA